MSDCETYIEGLGGTIPCNRVALECLLPLFDALDDLDRVRGPENIGDAVTAVVRWYRENNGVDDDIRNAVARWEDAVADERGRRAYELDENEPHPWNHDTPAERWGER